MVGCWGTGCSRRLETGQGEAGAGVTGQRARGGHLAGSVCHAESSACPEVSEATEAAGKLLAKP